MKTIKHISANWSKYWMTSKKCLKRADNFVLWAGPINSFIVLTTLPKCDICPVSCVPRGLVGFVLVFNPLIHLYFKCTTFLISLEISNLCLKIVVVYFKSALAYQRSK